MSLNQGLVCLQKSIVGNVYYTLVLADEGLLARDRAFGLVIADSSHLFWIGVGPVDMDPMKVNSSQPPEMAGYAGLWEVLVMLSIVYPQDFHGGAVEIISWVNSTSAPQCLRCCHGQDSKTRAYTAHFPHTMAVVANSSAQAAF